MNHPSIVMSVNRRTLKHLRNRCLHEMRMDEVVPGSKVRIGDACGMLYFVEKPGTIIETPQTIGRDREIKHAHKAWVEFDDKGIREWYESSL